MMRKGWWSSRKWKAGVKKGPWTGEEDEALRKYVEREGEGRWRTLPKRAGLQRCGKSCRLRWMNYLRPCVKRGHIAPDEEDLILRLHRLLGNRWSLIAGRIPGRTDNEIKNYWNSHLSKKLIRQGIDPRTHKPLSSSSHSPTPPPPTATVEHHNKKPPPPPPPPAAAIGSSSSSHMMMEPYIHITTPPSSSSDALDPCHPLQHDHDHPLPFPNINMPPTFSTTDNDNDDVFSSFLNSLINDHDDPFSNPTPPPL